MKPLLSTIAVEKVVEKSFFGPARPAITKPADIIA